MNNKKIISIIAIVLAVMMLLGLFIGMLPASVFADGEEDFSVNTQASVADLQARKEELAEKAQQSQDRIAELQDEQASLIEQKAAYDERDTYIREQIEITGQQIDIFRGLIEEKQKEVDAARALEERQLERYRSRVRAMEENGGYNILSIILRSESLSELLSEIDDIRDIMQSDRRLEDEYIAAREEHERVKAEYEAEKVNYESSLSALEQEQAQLMENIRETEDLMQKLGEEIEKNAAEYEAALNAIQTADRAIDAKITQLWLNYVAAHPEIMEQSTAQGTTIVQSGTGYYTGGTAVAADGSAAGYVGEYTSPTGTLAWPVPGCYSVSSDYGTRTHPITGEVSRMHYGMDIDGYGHDGGDIVSAGSGVVTEVGYNNGYGNYIVVDHGNGMQTLYAHMSGTAVSAGTTVGQGETIGYLGATGMATGTHCHVEVFVDGQNVDPADYFVG